MQNTWGSVKKTSRYPCADSGMGHFGIVSLYLCWNAAAGVAFARDWRHAAGPDSCPYNCHCACWAMAALSVLVALWLQFRHILKSRAHNFLLGQVFKVLFTGDCRGWVGSCSWDVWFWDANKVDIAWKEVQSQFEVLGFGKKDESRSVYSSMAHT